MGWQCRETKPPYPCQLCIVAGAGAAAAAPIPKEQIANETKT